MIIRIKNLKAQTILGIHDWEKEKPRDIIINAAITFADETSCTTDNVDDTLDYDALSQRIVAYVESVDTGLIEKLAHDVIALIMDDQRVTEATIEIDKPGAIKVSESVSVTLCKRR